MTQWSFLFSCLLVVAINTTMVTFYVDHKVEQPLDYVQITATVKTYGQKLQATINEAAEIIKNIDTFVDLYCHTYAKDRAECEDNVQASAYSINPQYEIKKNKRIFIRFVVTHQINIKVKQSAQFGQLIDEILKSGVNRINSLEWKPLQDINRQSEAVEAGVVQANQICQKIGMKLEKILSVQQVTNFGQEKDEVEPEQKRQEDEQEQQEELQDITDDIVYYKFAVQCHPKTK